MTSGESSVIPFICSLQVLDRKPLAADKVNDMKLIPFILQADTPKAVPLTCHGHSRPVTHLSFSPVGDDEQYYLISGCKGLGSSEYQVWTTLTF